MSRLHRFAYAQTRIQAHHAAFPGESQWQRLEAITNTEHLLETLRNSPLRPWVIGLNAQMDVHRLEQTFRTLFREYVNAVASWQPREWRVAVQWVKRLADIAALEHLLEHPVIAEWIRRDPALHPFALDDPDLRVRALQTSEYGPMIQGWREGPQRLASGWYRHWQTLWPRTSPAERRTLEWLSVQIANQQEMLASGELHSSRPARQKLLAVLIPEFRRQTFQPAAAFLHLAIMAIHLERLRGSLVQLLLFGGERAA